MNGSLDKYAESLEHIINFVMLGVYGTAIILFGGLLLLIIAARNLFHPLFCLFFSLIIVVYMICNTLSVISFYLRVSGYEGDNVYTVIGTIYQAAYIYLTCTVAFCVLERFMATVLSKSYEFRRNWIVFLFGQVVCGVIILLHIRVYNLGGIVSDMVQLALSCVILTCLTVLLLVNRRLTLVTRGQRSLSYRYQISENVRALRLVAPVVLLDTSVCAVDMIGSQLFQVHPAFEADVYKTSPSYFPAYIVLRFAAIVLQYGIPFVIVRDDSLKKVAAGAMSKVVGVSIQLQTEEVKTVLGTTLSRSASQMDYFNYLQHQWTQKI